MSVYHISGLGTSPGALTMPLTAVYLLHTAMETGHDGAIKFFEFTGKRENPDEKPYPEAVVVFTSKEVIEGHKKIKYRSEWFSFGTSKDGRAEPIHKPIKKYLCELIDYINTTFSLDINPPKVLYFIETDYQSFEDAYYKVGVTLNGLKRKEAWVNMIGGSNQINVALFLAGTYTAVPMRYYYLFQNNILKMEPEWIDKPTNVNSLWMCANKILSYWYKCSLPPFNLGIGSVLRNLYLLFRKKEKVSSAEIMKILKERGFDKKYIPKLIGSGYLISYGKEGPFLKGPALDSTIELWNKINKEGIDDTSEWEEWAKNEGILHEVKL